MFHFEIYKKCLGVRDLLIFPSFAKQEPEKDKTAFYCYKETISAVILRMLLLYLVIIAQKPEIEKLNSVLMRFISVCCLYEIV